jgi:phosphatidylserine/phosphatidylglycerophosphate/cardiolipin synthase-like enzyme
MRRPISSFFYISALLLLLTPSLVYPLTINLNNTPTQVYFSPKGAGTEVIISQITQARTEILVQSFTFTSVPIVKALVYAHKRGVQVQAILDKSRRSEKYTSATASYLKRRTSGVYSSSEILCCWYRTTAQSKSVSVLQL